MDFENRFLFENGEEFRMEKRCFYVHNNMFHAKIRALFVLFCRSLMAELEEFRNDPKSGPF
jgi:hypothetical protein